MQDHYLPMVAHGEWQEFLCRLLVQLRIATMCDAGGGYRGDLCAEEMLAQVRFVLRRRPEVLRSRKLKVHFARMGEPSLNPQVLEALRRLPDEAPAAGLMPCIASVAPAGSEPFFAKLTRLRHEVYAGRPFQLQLSLNTTDPALRRALIPARLLELETLAALGRRFHRPGQRKVVLNFALAAGVPVDVAALRATFDPACFAVKLTPMNPTDRARQHGLHTVLDAAHPNAANALAAELSAAGFDAVVSIGEPGRSRSAATAGRWLCAQQPSSRTGSARRPVPSQKRGEQSLRASCARSSLITSGRSAASRRSTTARSRYLPVSTKAARIPRRRAPARSENGSSEITSTRSGGSARARSASPKKPGRGLPTTSGSAPEA